MAVLGNLTVNGLPASGTTAQRPTNAQIGQLFFDTSIGALLSFDGTNWVGGGGGDELPGASTAAAGSTTTDAGVLPAATSHFYPTTAANDTKGVRINAADKVTGRRLEIGNGVSNKILIVYPPTGGTINGAAADAGFSSVSGKGVTIRCLSGSGNTWLAS